MIQPPLDAWDLAQMTDFLQSTGSIAPDERVDNSELWLTRLSKLTTLRAALIREFRPRTYADWQRTGAIIEHRQAILDTIPEGDFICRDKAIELLSQPEIVTRSVSDYRRSVRALVRGLYKSEFTLFEFIDQMTGAIRRNMTQAWAEGAKSCGVSLDELTEREQKALADKINGQLPYLPGFAQAIIEAREAKEKQQPLYDRAELWIGQWEGAKVMGAAYACGDSKRRWVIGPTESHCQSCSALNGKVKRYSFWLAHVLPRNGPNDRLACKGYRCLCTLQETDEPITKGPLPLGL